MRLYLDDNIASPLLATLLRKAGHDVQLPRDVNLRGKDDAVHLTHAIAANRACLSEDYEDFENLHNLIMQAGGNHPGILVARRDNDPKRDLKPMGIVRAIAKLINARLQIPNVYLVLNQWR